MPPKNKINITASNTIPLIIVLIIVAGVGFGLWKVVTAERVTPAPYVVPEIVKATSGSRTTSFTKWTLEDGTVCYGSNNMGSTRFGGCIGAIK